MEEKEILDLDSDFIVIAVPSDSVEIELTATVYLDGKLRRVSRKMDFQEVRAAIKEANDGYIPHDALFTLVPHGEDKIKELVRRYMEGAEDA